MQEASLYTGANCPLLPRARSNTCWRPDLVCENCVWVFVKIGPQNCGRPSGVPCKPPPKTATSRSTHPGGPPSSRVAPEADTQEVSPVLLVQVAVKETSNGMGRFFLATLVWGTPPSRTSAHPSFFGWLSREPKGK